MWDYYEINIKFVIHLSVINQWFRSASRLSNKDMLSINTPFQTVPLLKRSSFLKNAASTVSSSSKNNKFTSSSARIQLRVTYRKITLTSIKSFRNSASMSPQRRERRTIKPNTRFLPRNKIKLCSCRLTMRFWKIKSCSWCTKSSRRAKLRLKYSNRKHLSF